MSMKKHVLVCILSEQHIPNLLSVHELQPDWLVLVETAKMREQRAADHFLGALRIGGRDFAERHDPCLVEAAPTAGIISAVREALAPAWERHPGASFTVNLTGGNKLMSIGAYDLAREHGARAVYIDIDDPDLLLDLGDPKQNQRCNYQPSVREFLAGYGYKFQKPEDKLREGEQRAEADWSCARRLAAEALGENLLRVQDEQEWDKARKQGLVLEPRHTEHLPPSVRAALDAFLGREAAPDAPVQKLDRHQVVFLTGGWLEAFLFGLVRKHAHRLGLWDVRLGVHAARDEVSNDLDVAFMSRQGLHWIECKSGDQENDPNAEARFKVEAVTRQFRALRVRAILATTSDNVIDRSTGRLRPVVQRRAELHGYRILTRADIQRLAKTEDSEVVREVLLGQRPA